MLELAGPGGLSILLGFNYHPKTLGNLLSLSRMTSLIKAYKHGWEKMLGVDDDDENKRGHRYSPTSLNTFVKTKNQTINANANFYGLYKGLTLKKLLHPNFLHQDIHFDLQEARDFINMKHNYNTENHTNKLRQLRHLLYEIKRFVENKENPNYALEISTLKKHITPEFWENSDLLNHVNTLINSIRTTSRSALSMGKMHMETRGRRSSRKQIKTRKNRMFKN
jgi:hypothetical protein